MFAYQIVPASYRQVQALLSCPCSCRQTATCLYHVAFVVSILRSNISYAQASIRKNNFGSKRRLLDVRLGFGDQRSCPQVRTRMLLNRPVLCVSYALRVPFVESSTKTCTQDLSSTIEVRNHSKYLCRTVRRLTARQARLEGSYGPLGYWHSFVACCANFDEFRIPGAT